MIKKERNKKNLAVAVFFVAAALSALIAVGTKNEPERSSKLVFVLDYGNNNRQAFRVPVSGQKKVWSLLQQAAAMENIDLRADKDFVPVKIDGFPNGRDGKKWAFYVNGVKQESSPVETMVKEKDKVVFRFE
ncbi:MAG: hypothetical protein GXP44_03195 [bacterium]|nr:hypothetical protein [bacterium]